MNIENDKTSMVIIRALNALSKQVDDTNKSENEKEILKLLVTRMKEYYCKRISSISSFETEKLFNLQSFVTDIIVSINSSLRDEADLVSYVEKINKVLKDKELSHLVSRQKLLKYKLR